MNLLADESIDGPIVAQLRQAGHQVLYVAEMEPGISDDLVLERANQTESLLLTADKDFGELVFRHHRLNYGIILIRLTGIAPTDKAVIVVSVVRKYERQLPFAFTVISPKIVRIRKARE